MRLDTLSSFKVIFNSNENGAWDYNDICAFVVFLSDPKPLSLLSKHGKCNFISGFKRGRCP